jgi:hypothetical protein
LSRMELVPLEGYIAGGCAEEKDTGFGKNVHHDSSRPHYLSSC